MISPVTYQGGKQRVASKIVDLMNVPVDVPFFDLCCGSGAISIEMVNRGFPVSQITMLDAGPWSEFWKLVGEGRFDLSLFRTYIDSIPKNADLIQDFLRELSTQSSDVDTAYVYLLLQAGAFGGKAVWEMNDAWQTPGFRSYWKPTAISNRRSPVNPMMPMPSTLYERTVNVCEGMLGICGIREDAINVHVPDPSCVVYIDPPYQGATQYGHSVDAVSLAESMFRKTFISESVPLNEDAILVSKGRSKGGISGSRTSALEEWLTPYFSWIGA